MVLNLPMKYSAIKQTANSGMKTEEMHFLLSLRQIGAVFFWCVCYTGDWKMKGNPRKTLRPSFAFTVAGITG